MFVGFGVAGWALENLLYPGRRSRVWNKLGVPEGATIPLMPVYGAAGVALLALAPVVKNKSHIDRFAVYAGALSAIELLACQIDRATGGESWDYTGYGGGTGPCVDVPHSLAWAGLALIAEKWIK